MPDPVSLAIYIIISVIVVSIMVVIYFRFDTSRDQYELIRQEKVRETIKWLYQSVNDICYQCNMSPIYEIKETSQITYTDKIIAPHNIKGTIYLAVWDPERRRIYDHNTLIYSVLHEIAHILSPSIKHEPPFDSIESILLNKATELSYYNPNIPIDSNYLTLDLTGPFN
jgi:hypothetical protein